MRKLFLLIIILTLNLFAQGWNNIVTTDIVEPYKTDIFTNSSGIHIIIQNSGNDIVYYNLNSEGIVCTTKTCTLGTSGSFPNIVGTNDKIYAIYKTGNNIRVRYSTDNGSSWLTNIEDRPITANDCNGVDAVYDLGNGVHIVWATRDDSTPAFETYYYLLNTDHSWVNPKTVTDHNAAQTGGNPCVTVSPNRVHVSFNTDATTSLTAPGAVKTRDKLNGLWQTPQTVDPDEQSIDERLLVRGGYLYLFYVHPISGPDNLRYKKRSFPAASWPTEFTQIESGTLLGYEDAFEITKTNNDDIHLLCKKWYQTRYSFTYKYYNGAYWSTYDEFDSLSIQITLRQIGLSSVSDDLFCTWVKWESPIKYMRFRQYDAIPLAPTGLTITKSANNHPLLSWLPNNEPDKSFYKIYRWDSYNGVWQYLNQTSNTSYEDGSLTYCPPKIICPDERNFSFRVTAVDLTSHESAPSNEVVVSLVGGPPPPKIVADPGSNELIEYSLSQNYPNPFNPNTTIDYSTKSSGLATLIVYDMLGTEVASLVNENKEAGNYSVEFNASELPSGIYFYTLTSGNFIDSKKLILLK